MQPINLCLGTGFIDVFHADGYGYRYPFDGVPMCYGNTFTIRKLRPCRSATQHILPKVTAYPDKQDIDITIWSVSDIAILVCYGRIIKEILRVEKWTGIYKITYRSTNELSYREVHEFKIILKQLVPGDISVNKAPIECDLTCYE